MASRSEASCGEIAARDVMPGPFVKLPLAAVGRSLAVASVPEVVGKRRMGWLPAEFGPGPGGVGALVEQQDFGEVVAEAGPGLLIGPGGCSWGAGGDRGRLGEF